MTDEITEKELIAAEFFTAESEMPPKRQRGKMPVDVAALQKFARAMDAMSPPQRRAAINWLTSAYLDRK
jgi:hypothetical protein